MNYLLSMGQRIMAITIILFGFSGLNTATAGVPEDIRYAADDGVFSNVVLLVNSVTTTDQVAAKTALTYALSQMAIVCKTYTMNGAIEAWNNKFRNDTVLPGVEGLLQDILGRRGCLQDVLG